MKSKKGFIKIPNSLLSFDGIIMGTKDAIPYKIKLVGVDFDTDNSKFIQDRLSFVNET